MSILQNLVAPVALAWESKKPAHRGWRDRANVGALDLQASAACDLRSTLADENLCDRLRAARILQGWLQGVA